MAESNILRRDAVATGK